MSSTDPTARALALLSLLQTHRVWAGNELAHRLGVSQRTVRRDVDRLRTLGYGVDAAPGLEGGYRLSAGTHLPPLLVDDDEALALVMGLRAAAGMAIEGIEETAVALMSKLDQMLPSRVQRRVATLQSSVEVLRWSPPRELIAPGTLIVLSQGCRDHEEVHFDYRRRDGEDSRRRVQPHQLVSVGRRWYLVAWDVRREDWRTFRVDRMEAPALIGARFLPRELPTADAATFVAQGMRAVVSEFGATVLIGATAADLASAYWFDASQSIEVDGQVQTVLFAESASRLAAMIAALAVEYAVTLLEAPSEVRRCLDLAKQRLDVA